MREPISACVITCNEEKKIARCLQSVTWCDEIVVIDSFSTDRTVEICRTFTDRVYQHAWSGYVGQRNLLRDKATHPWALFVDADEEVSKALRDEILAEMNKGPGSIVGYEFPRQVYYLGRWIRHGEWNPDVKLRLFRKEFGRTEGEEPHDRVIVNGPVKRLKGHLWHYTYADLGDQMQTLNRFSGISAQHRFIKNKRFRWSDLLLRPIARFLKGYFLKGGILDGPHGFIIAVMNAFGVFVKYAKQWELQRRQKSNFRELPDP